jgi:hypothetical protein
LKSFRKRLEGLVEFLVHSVRSKRPQRRREKPRSSKHRSRREDHVIPTPIE